MSMDIPAAGPFRPEAPEPGIPGPVAAAMPHEPVAGGLAPSSRLRRAAVLAIMAMSLPGCLKDVVEALCHDHTCEGSSAGPGLSPEQQQRQQEVDAYVGQLYEALGYAIAGTTRTEQGDTVDWIDASSVAGSDDEQPPFSDEIALPDGVDVQRSELDEHPELAGPEGAIPLYRPEFPAYVRGDSGASSLEDYLEHHQETGRVDGQNRLYAGLAWDTPNTGAVAWVNQFAGDVEPGTFSLIELAVFCKGPDAPNTLEQIGIVASRDRANFGDGLLRLHVEFMTHGTKAFGDKQGGWDEVQLGFNPASGRRHAPTMRLAASTVGGPQEEARFEIRLFNDEWWIGYNGEWLGRYPASLFMLLRTGACSAAWYGEVFDPDPRRWTADDMGSGQFADRGFGNAAWIRNPAIYRDASGFWTSPATDNAMQPFDPACYTRTALLPGGSGEPWFFLGGPGGDAPGGGCR